ncbi:MAG: ribosome recycling factor [Ferrimicrobium sp.]
MAELVDTDSVVKETTDKMAKAVAHTEDEFGAIRTGRASSALVERLMVDYYGSMVPLQTIAGISIPEARTLVVTPYDRGSLGAVERAIRDSDLGVNPTNDGSVVRISLQPPTEERRRELIKVVRHKAEEGRIAIRTLRRGARHTFDGWQKQGSLTTDDVTELDRELERLTARFVGELDRALEVKERDLLEV